MFTVLFSKEAMEDLEIAIDFLQQYFRGIRKEIYSKL